MRTYDDAWTIDQVVFLVRNYPTMPRKELKAGIDQRGPRRSLDAIGGKARAMGVERQVNAGKFNGSNGRPFKPGENRQPTPLRDAIVQELIKHGTRTVAEVAELTGTRKASCWKVFHHLIDQGNCHVSEYRPRPCGQYEAVYRLGAGRNARPPQRKAAKAVNPAAAPRLSLDPPLPIPVPQQSLWGICIRAGIAGGKELSA